MRGLKIATGSLVATTAFVGLVAAAAAGRPLDHEPLRSAAPVGRLVATLPTEALALDGQRRTLARTETVTLGERGPNPVTPGERGATPGERGPNPVTPGERGATPGERGPSDAGGRVVPVEMTASALRAASPVPDVSGFPDLAWGEEGDAVTVAQRRLAELGFLDPGDVNGYFGEPTWSAVLAFQKFEELERTAWLDQVTWQRLFRPTGHLPRPRPTSVAGIEVDLERQLTFVINLDSPGSIRILNSSSGGNYYYTDPETGAGHYAYTPTGAYEVYRTHDGPEVAPLGTLYRPLYFTGGWALHGSLDVPAYPASHGCVRLSYADTDWLWQYAGEGTAVEVFETMSPEVLWRQEIIDDTEPYLAAHPDEATVTNLSAA